MNWIRYLHPVKLEVAFLESCPLELATEKFPSIGQGWISLEKTTEYEAFKNSALYKLFLKGIKKQKLKLLQKDNIKAIGLKWLRAGFKDSDFTRNMFSIVVKYYAVYVPRFVKTYHLNKNKYYANNKRNMRRQNMEGRRRRP